MSTRDSTCRCRHCDQTFTRRSSKGRPPTFCSPACRSAAYRARTTVDALPVRDPLVAQLGEDVVAHARRLGRLARATDPRRALEVLKQLSALNREIADFTAVAVQQARTSGVSWPAIGEALHMSGDTARTHWSAEQVRRRLDNRRRSTAPSAPRPKGTDGPPARTPSDAARPRPRNGPGREPGRSSPRRSTPLSAALVNLHRASGKSLRGIAREAGVSASFASRVLSGERHPSWSTTKALALACGADPISVRPVWESSHTHNPARATALDRQALAILAAAGIAPPSRLPTAPGPNEAPAALATTPADQRELLRLFLALHRHQQADHPLINPALTSAQASPSPASQQPTLPAAAFG